MIQIIESATERTTAATDLVLAVEFLLFAIFFFNTASGYKRVMAWGIPFLLLAGAFLIGAIAHGLQMPENINKVLWLFLAAGSAFGLAHLVSASVGEWKPAWYKNSVFGMSLAAIIFIGITVNFSSFTVYVVFIVITMALVSLLNAMCFKKSRNRKHLLIIFGAALTAVASLLQLVKSIHFTIIWKFDYNGAFHLVQMLAGIFLGVGINGLLKSACLNSDYIIESDRLGFGMLEKHDFENLVKLDMDPEVRAFFPGGVSTPELLQEKIVRSRTNFLEKGFGEFSITELKTNRFLGRAGFAELDNGEIEVGYLFLKEFWGQGMATEALGALLNWAENALPAPRILAYAPVNHHASIGVMKKAGMRYLKTETKNGTQFIFYEYPLKPRDGT